MSEIYGKGNPNEEIDIRERITQSHISDEAKKDLFAVVDGEKLAELYSDAIAKKAFSPDKHPERLDFLLQHVMNDKSIEVYHSASNESILSSKYSKKVISDIPAWLKDHRRADLEIQAAAQNYIYNRADIYSSEMLMIQYSVDEGQKKDEMNYEKVKGVIIVVLMVKSPEIFKEFKSDRYIHRITKATADSGMVFPMLRQMAFVQLDKALEEYLTGTYNEDEDVELLELLAMIADINNDKIKNDTEGKPFFDDIRKEVSEFSADKEVQAMLLEEKMAILDMQMTKAEGKVEGKAEEHAELQDVYRWLFSSGRGSDVERATNDEEFYNELLKEYKSTKQ
ncbi:PD-(D/E)XK nuclease family transposase [Butyrivibrio sp. VCD2006]|uniref:PD-(D/E)XK nuclease family transposase n=1 Tax=Butyrivibrio sp. VCD2006 TaxID=1280664 RepID=UPI0003FE8AFE|nr:PD-(D/E)XK nuclease family transposase [Butyrivibrio sp. VCD2006]